MMIAYFLGMSAVMGGLFTLIGWLIWKGIDYGRTWLVLVNHDTGKASCRRVKFNVKGFTDKRAGKKRTYLPEGKARYSANKSPLFIMDEETGINYVGESMATMKALAEKDENISKMVVNNPLLYYNAFEVKEVQDTLDSNGTSEHWMAKLAPWAFAALMALMFMVGYLLYAFNKSQGE